MEERKMTIARGLTRLKTIKAQLDNIADQIGEGGAICNKSRHPMGDQRVSLEKNHNQAIEEINSLYQKFNDLVKEYIKIKLAIDRANMTTVIRIGGKEMTIQEALIYRRDIAGYVHSLNSEYSRAVMKAQSQADNYNKNINTEGMDETALKAVLADVLYLVPRERINEVNEFLVEFMTELDGTLNEVNAITEITVEG